MFCLENLKKRKIKLFILLFLCIFVSVSWMVSKNNTFIFDDYSNILMAKTHSYSQIFKFLPSQRYNDRCIAVMFVKLLYDMFGLNIQSYHIVYAILHYVNVILVYRIITLLMHDSDEETRLNCGIIGAGIFGVYPISLMAVSWVSAEYEMICSLFYLLCIVFYLKQRTQNKYRCFYSICCILSFYLAIRSKEMAIVLPIIIILYEIASYIKSKKLDIPKVLIFLCICMIVFAIILFSKSDVSDLLPNHPYYQDYNPISMLKIAFCYLLLYFDLANFGFDFITPSLSSYIGAAFTVVIVVYGIYIWIRKKEVSIIFSIIAVGVALAPVLQLTNLQHRLYLYIPSVFIGITLAFLLKELTLNLKSKKNALIIVVMAVMAMMLVNFAPGVVRYKQMWLQYCENDRKEIKQLLQKDYLVDNSNVYVKGANEGYNIFYYGPGNSVKLFGGNENINIILADDFPDDPQTPYALWEYQNGKIIEIGRDSSPKPILLLEVFPNVIDLKGYDNEFNLSVTCEEINDNMVIIINEHELTTVVGKEFLAASVNIEEIDGEQKLAVKVKDCKTGAVSNVLFVEMQ